MHLAIIMDGNGRWAKKRGLKRIEGHKKGAEVVKEITTYCANNPEISILTLYAFSTENWKGPKMEVEFLMKLLDNLLKKELDTLSKHLDTSRLVRQLHFGGGTPTFFTPEELDEIYTLIESHFKNY